MNGACELVRPERGRPHRARRSSHVSPDVRAARATWRRCLMHNVGLSEAICDAADLAVNVDIDVATGAKPLVVQHWCVRLHRLDRIQHHGQRLVADIEQPTCRLGDSLRTPRSRPRHADRRSAPRCRACRCRLDRPDDPHASRCCTGAGYILPREDTDDARQRSGAALVDANNAGMGMWRAQHLQVQQALHDHVHRIAGVAVTMSSLNGLTRLAPQACPAVSASADQIRGWHRRSTDSRCSDRDCPSAHAGDPPSAPR